MSQRLRKYIVSSYCNLPDSIPHRIKRDFAIQIDDQDDRDNLTEFCNIFVTVGKKDRFEIDFCGNIPLNNELVDLVDIYNGTSDLTHGRITLDLHVYQADALLDVAKKIKASSDMSTNPNWYKIAARTISSLYRFVRVLQGFRPLTKA